MLANVIFPAPLTPYVANFFIPASAVLALGTELTVFSLFQRSTISFVRLALIVVGINVFSWIVGVIVAYLPILPSGLVPQLLDGQHSIITTGPHWSLIACLSFVWACILSAVLEYGVLWCFRRRLHLRRMAPCVVTANVSSYAVIALTVWVFLKAGWV